MAKSHRYRLRITVHLWLFVAVFAGFLMAGPHGFRAFAENNVNNTDAYSVVTLQKDMVLSTSGDVVMFNDEIALFGNGPYCLQGELEDFCIHIRAKGETTVILDNAVITNTTGEAIASDAKCRLKLVLADDSRNILTSGTERDLIPDKEATGAAIYAKGDLLITGNGSLEIKGYLNNGIRCKGEFRVSDTEKLEIRAANRAIRAVDCSLEGGNIETVSGDNGIYTENSLEILGGILTAETSDHCVKSEGTVDIEGGEIRLLSPEKRGIIAMNTVTVSGGSLNIDVLGDGIFSEQGIEVSGGSVMVRSGADGLQVGGQREYAEAPIQITGGEVLISAYEDALDTLKGYKIDGGTLLATEISGQRRGPVPENPQEVFFQSYKGKKHDMITLLDGKTELTGMEAAYGFNTVIYSVPDDIAQGRIQLRVGS